MRDEIDFGGELIELSGLSLQEVGDLEGSALDAELRELLSDVGSGHGLTAGFQSNI
jgi:FXSXX-COOH protein